MVSAALFSTVHNLWFGVFALAAVAAAVTIWFWDRAVQIRLVMLYAVAWFLLTMAQMARGASPGSHYVWTGLAEWAGLLLVAAIVGWLIRRPRVASALRLSAGSDRWFMVSQAVILVAVALLVGWVATDFSFDGVGTGFALFGLAGRACACPSALMLVGGSIVMAWQSTGWWRAMWQFAAMLAGVLFTTSIGWARIDAASQAPWLARTGNLMISTGMMTIMTWYGLPRVLPKDSDWIQRGRQAAPFFAAAALLLLATTLIAKLVAAL